MNDKNLDSGPSVVYIGAWALDQLLSNGYVSCQLDTHGKSSYADGRPPVALHVTPPAGARDAVAGDLASDLLCLADNCSEGRDPTVLSTDIKNIGFIAARHMLRKAAQALTGNADDAQSAATGAGEYDRELIASMLEASRKGALFRYSVESIETQCRLLREADNRDAAGGGRTVCRSAP